MLILDILGSDGDFNIDHLRLGNDSTFDLTDLHVVFNFLGNTDPNAFARRAGSTSTTSCSRSMSHREVTGLSTVFAPGQTWTDVVDAANITAVSSVYDLSDTAARGGRQRDRRRRARAGAVDLGDAPARAAGHRQRWRGVARSIGLTSLRDHARAMAVQDLTALGPVAPSRGRQRNPVHPIASRRRRRKDSSSSSSRSLEGLYREIVKALAELGAKSNDRQCSTSSPHRA